LAAYEAKYVSKGGQGKAPEPNFKLRVDVTIVCVAPPLRVAEVEGAETEGAVTEGAVTEGAETEGADLCDYTGQLHTEGADDNQT